MFNGFANIRNSLLPVVFLRRIARELKRANDLAELKLSLAHPAWYKAYQAGGAQLKPGQFARPKLTDIDNPSVESWNTEYAKTHDVPEDDEY